MYPLSPNAHGLQHQPPKEKGKQHWHRVSRRKPCPVCGKDDNCTVSNDGLAVWCGRESVGAVKGPNAGGQHLHRLDEQRRQPLYVHPSHNRKPKPPTKDWQAEVEKLAAAGADHLHELAALLHVDEDALRRLHVGRGVVDRRLGWSFPECDATGRVIGINHRSHDGKKKQAIGSARGLTYAADWHVPPGYIFLVEGGSDTAALMTMGFAVIGRPSNCGGVELLSELLRPHADRRIVVVAERDKKPDGRWPGRAGAISTATQLAERLGRSIVWTLPPEGSKDVRELLVSRGAAARDAFLDGLVLETIAPPPSVDVVRYVEPVGRVRTLDDWRDEMRRNRIASLDTVGVYFDGSPTGAGKSHADALTIAAVPSSLTVVPTHAIARELQADLIVKHGLVEVEIYPQICEATCANLDEAKRVLAAGLKVGAALCPDCPHKETCEYRRHMDRAKQAAHVIGTHERLARQPDMAAGKEFVSIHEDAQGLLRPTAKCSAADVAKVEQIGREATWLLREDSNAVDLDGLTYFQEMSAAALKLVEQIEEADATTSVPLIPRVNDTKHVERTAWRAMKRLDNPASGDAMRICTAYLRGELADLVVKVDRIRIKGGAGETIKSLVGVWQTKLPTDAVVWLADATGDVETLSHLAGRPIIDKTPEGRLERRTKAEQVPVDLTLGASAKTVAAYLRGLLLSHPEAQRVGIIGHKKHIDGLLRKRSPLLDDELRDRIVKHAHFREGPDRASNDWHQACDLVIILGTPRVPPNAVADELVRRGQIEAARRDGGWRSYSWEGRTAAGELRRVEASGYADEQWQAAHRDLVQAGLVQAVGRGRGILDDGVPVILLSNEPVGLALAEQADLVRITDGMLATLAAMQALTDDGVPVSTSAVAEALGICERQARRLIGQALAAVEPVQPNQSDINAKSILLGEMSVIEGPDADIIEPEDWHRHEELAIILAEEKTAFHEARTGPPTPRPDILFVRPPRPPMGLLGVGALLGPDNGGLIEHLGGTPSVPARGISTRR